MRLGHVGWEVKGRWQCMIARCQVSLNEDCQMRLLKDDLGSWFGATNGQRLPTWCLVLLILAM